MRLSAVSTIFLACLTISGCAARGEREAAQAAPPSKELTGSITKTSRVVPSVEIGETVSRVERQQALAVAMPTNLRPEGLMPSDQSGDDDAPVPLQRPLAMLSPSNPVPRALRQQPMQIYSHRFRDAKPINFGTSTSPRKLAVHGVDVSRWQGEIDWDTLRTQGANFVYIKATDGGDHLDPMFKKNWRAAQQAGLKHGAYHFFYWCRTAGEQADWFIRNVPKEAGALPPVIDVEWNGESSCKRRPSREQVLAKMQVFMDKLEKHYGQRPIVYTAPDFYRDNLSGELLDYPFWLRAVAQHPSKVYPGRKWLFWQYSGSGVSHGVEGRIDLNAFHGSEQDWHNWVASSVH
ncbi:GH25 family lysozyme [Rhizobium sp. CNPSo 4062]|uniref:glycoside hydrolase family 25 protein n=1 Tax=Rhizobium sp. CNPSo 4062 TaxID=3021410 RepID=UPI000DE14A55|nr:GH25 family lysozyme [Rhizobium sp. CNPSo 4062]MDK4703803.1 GH25 family lysozyme [Rhizobium sp. CNPSo 4062]